MSEKQLWQYLETIEGKDKLLEIINSNIEEIERLHSILEELKVKCYETFWIKQNGSYTITETDYKDIEEILDKAGSDK